MNQAIKSINQNLLITLRKRINTYKGVRADELSALNNLATLGQLSAGLTHEIVTPLTNIQIILSNLSQSDEYKNGRYEGEVRTALAGVEQINALVKNYLRNAKGTNKKDNLTKFHTGKEIHKAANMLEYKLRQRNISLKIEIRDDVNLHGDTVKFGQVITNLILNAIDAYEDLKVGEFKVIEVVVEKNARNTVKIKVVDFGSGVEKKDRTKIFDAFYTTKPPEQGTGLGLSICKRIIEDDFGGQIKLTSTGMPTVFKIKMPISKKFS